MTRLKRGTRTHEDEVIDSLKADSQSLDKPREKSIRGSGFTYDEEKERTDISVPENESKDAGRKLPDLGKPNRA